jgi:hypothetical protein
MTIALTTRLKHAFRLLAVVSILTAIIFIPGLPWSSRVHHQLNRLIVKAEMRLSRWSGYEPYLASITGHVNLPGARIEVIDSASGWATLADSEGKFVLRDVMWYPGAEFDLLISDETRIARVIQVTAPEQLAENRSFDVGFLDFNNGEEVELDETHGINSTTLREYDLANLAYYRDLFTQLTEGKNSDEERLDAINKFVASRLNYEATTRNYKSPRLVIEHGSHYCGSLALAMATIAESGNYKTRILDLIGNEPESRTHIVVEVYYGDRWHIYDPTYGTMFRDRNGSVADYKTIRLENMLIKAESFRSLDNKGVLEVMKWMPGVYKSGSHHFYEFESR